MKLIGKQYKINNATADCRFDIDPYKQGGLRFGDLQDPTGARVYDLDHNEKFCISVNTFLKTLKQSRINLNSYSVDNLEIIENFIRKYVEKFTSPKIANEIINMTKNYSDVEKAKLYDCVDEIIIGSKYYNEIFYDTAFFIYNNILPDELKDAIYNEIVVGEVKFPHKAIINTFDAIGYINIDFIPNNLIFKITDNRSKFMKYFYAAFSTNSAEYADLIKKFCIFLSNWTLFFGVLLSCTTYGQCSFEMIWEYNAYDLSDRNEALNQEDIIKEIEHSGINAAVLFDAAMKMCDDPHISLESRLMYEDPDFVQLEADRMLINFINFYIYLKSKNKLNQ